MKTFQLGGGFLVNTVLIPLCSVYNVYDVTSRKKKLLIHFWLVTKSNANSLYCL